MMSRVDNFHDLWYDALFAKSISIASGFQARTAVLHMPGRYLYNLVMLGKSHLSQTDFDLAARRFSCFYLFFCMIVMSCCAP